MDFRDQGTGRMGWLKRSGIAIALLLGALAVALSDDPRPVPDAEAAGFYSSISGRVTNEAGQPLWKACVWFNHFTDEYDEDNFFGMKRTDRDGRFTLRKGFLNRPIDVDIRFTPCNQKYPGYISEVFNGVQAAWYGWPTAKANAKGTKVRLGPGDDVTGINARLAKAGSISGHVTDQRGRPMGGFRGRVCLVAIDARYFNRRLKEADDGTTGHVFTGQTDKRGRYLIGTLYTGRYHVYTWDCNEPDRFTPEFWPNAATGVGSKPVRVTAGRDTGHVDFKLERLPDCKVEAVDPNRASWGAAVAWVRGGEHGCTVRLSSAKVKIGGQVYTFVRNREKPRRVAPGKSWKLVVPFGGSLTAKIKKALSRGVKVRSKIEVIADGLRVSAEAAVK